MKPIPSVLTTAGAIAVCVFVITAIVDNVSSAAPRPSVKDRIERGRYIVHQVGLCIDCHSPRNERGEFLEHKHLTGSPIPFTPTVAMPWSPAAPRIAGIPAGYTEKDFVHFLMTGERPNGLPPVLPPMPPYRMDREDAEAVAAYVHTLPGGTE